MNARSIRRLTDVTNKFVHVLRMFCIILSVVFMGAMVIQVFMRYVLNNPLYGIDELVTCLMVWYCAIGTVVCFWEEAHAMIVFLLKYFPSKVEWTVELCENIIILTCSVLCFIAGLKLIPMQLKTFPMGGLPFNRAYYYALPIIVMSALLILLEIVRFLRFLFDRKDYEARDRKGDN